MNEKKVYQTPKLEELGQVSALIQQNGLYGAVDGPIVVIGGYGYSPHQSY